MESPKGIESPQTPAQRWKITASFDVDSKKALQTVEILLSPEGNIEIKVVKDEMYRSTRPTDIIIEDASDADIREIEHLVGGIESLSEDLEVRGRIILKVLNASFELAQIKTAPTLPAVPVASPQLEAAFGVGSGALTVLDDIEPIRSGDPRTCEVRLRAILVEAISPAFRADSLCLDQNILERFRDMKTGEEQTIKFNEIQQALVKKQKAQDTGYGSKLFKNAQALKIISIEEPESETLARKDFTRNRDILVITCFSEILYFDTRSGILLLKHSQEP